LSAGAAVASINNGQSLTLLLLLLRQAAAAVAGGCCFRQLLLLPSLPCRQLLLTVVVSVSCRRRLARVGRPG